MKRLRSFLCMLATLMAVANVRAENLSPILFQATNLGIRAVLARSTDEKSGHPVYSVVYLEVLDPWYHPNSPRARELTEADILSVKTVAHPAEHIPFADHRVEIQLKPESLPPAGFPSKIVLFPKTNHMGPFNLGTETTLAYQIISYLDARTPVLTENSRLNLSEPSGDYLAAVRRGGNIVVPPKAIRDEAIHQLRAEREKRSALKALFHDTRSEGKTCGPSLIAFLDAT